MSVISCNPLNIFSWPPVVIDLQWMQFLKLASSFKCYFTHGHGSAKRYTFYHSLWITMIHRRWYLSSNTASKLSQTLAQTKWLRTTPCLRNIKQFGKKIHNHVPFDINSSKRPSSFCLYGRNMPSKCNEFGMDPRIIVLFDSPKLSYEEALKFCPHGLCKFHFFLFKSTKKLRGSIDGCRPVSNWLWQIRRIRTFQWSTCLDKHRIRDPRTAWFTKQSLFSSF